MTWINFASISRDELRQHVTRDKWPFSAMTRIPLPVKKSLIGRIERSPSQADLSHCVSQLCKLPRISLQNLGYAASPSRGLLFAAIASLLLAVVRLLTRFLLASIPLIPLTTDGYVRGSNHGSDGCKISVGKVREPGRRVAHGLGCASS